jgi:competence ComEA-like helix-hairpin-helix protein
MKKFVSEYLTFTKKERTGIVVITVLIIVFTAAPFFYPYFISHKKYDHSQFEKEIAAIKISQADSGEERPKYYNKNYTRTYPDSYAHYDKQASAGELFYFDPNTLSIEGWMKLGIREKTAATIQKYISKGGRFHGPEDLKKIWGLHEDEVNRLMPYVRIATVQPVASAQVEEYKTNYKPRPELKPFDINSADTTAFISLPGIGSKLASRIVVFREKLGGFYKIEQVAETYGLADSVFQKIKSKLILLNKNVKQLNINSATMDEMKQHPYIRYVLANAIVQYRSQHGKYNSVDDIKKIQFVTDEIFNKLSAYLTVQ